MRKYLIVNTEEISATRRRLSSDIGDLLRDVYKYREINVVCKPGLKCVPARAIFDFATDRSIDRSIDRGRRAFSPLLFLHSPHSLRVHFVRPLLSTSSISASSSRSKTRVPPLSLSVFRLSPRLPPGFYYAAKLALIGSTSIAIMRKVVGAALLWSSATSTTHFTSQLPSPSPL